ncbi:hypothetical protein [Okeania sp. SIO2B3]|uniref:hypothetical protein n=1 Tax=Okeania sp. SIO2B3 TaxID=2607784 RepID=UPI0013BF3719|nr:hypothetical protein [Okeania sp. SIO2B3]NET44149.1 hypothetical protein [Okeania sp. SIO2B3]
MLRFIVIISCIFLIFTSSGVVLAAELPRLTVDEGDTPLVIKGTLDKDTTSFSGNVRLTVTGGEIKDLQLLPSDLNNTDDDSVVIDRSEIRIPTGISLSDGQPRDVRVKVNNITHPGEYKGKLNFMLSGQTEGKPLEIPLELNIDAEPNVVPVSDNLNLQVVRCQNFLSCGLATWLLPDGVVQDKWTVQLDNQTLIPVKLTDATVVMQGEKTGNPVNNNDIFFPVPKQELKAQKVEFIDLKINGNQLSPDRYQGTLRFKLENADEPVKINATVVVRDAPIFALIVILVGILVGRLAQDMENPKAQKQVKLYPRYVQLRGNAANIKNESAFAYLEQQFKAVKEKIDKGEETEEALEQELNRLEINVSFLTNLEVLESKLNESELDALKARLNPQIKGAINSLIAGNIEQAQQLGKEVEQILREAQTDGSMGIADDIIQPLLDGFRASRDKLVDTIQALKPKLPGSRRWNWLAKFLAALSGVQTLNTEVRYWLIRPILWLVLLIVLVLLGLQTLYVNAGATFGVNGLYDYLGLFLWGLSADIANLGLRKLQSGGKKEEGETN